MLRKAKRSLTKKIAKLRNQLKRRRKMMKAMMKNHPVRVMNYV